MITNNFFKQGAKLMLAFLVLSGCSNKNKSDITGWNYNDPKWGGYTVTPESEQITGPNLVPIEGGAFTMGVTEEDVMFEYNNIPRKVTVRSFYIDETEVANVHYREYTYWINRVFGENNKQIARAALPDTLVWREELAYNEPYVEYYFRHPSYNFYPVVGVSWLQANDFCKWRSDRVNEMLMVKDGYIDMTVDQKDENNFTTEAYMAGQYEPAIKNSKKSNNPDEEGTRSLGMSDGVILPNYRLPTEAEWEYAALALVGNLPMEGEELITDRRIYPWDGATTRYQKRNASQGSFLANFKRGAGDMMGIAGALNDNAAVTAPVRSNMPNDFGLFNMAGNVSEWVQDVYRQMTFADAEDFNPFRGNLFQELARDESGELLPKDSTGRLIRVIQNQDDVANRRNYRSPYAIDYGDGDTLSEVEYLYGVTSLISDKARVYKGGSWNDRAYWLSPGTRRYLNEDMSSSTIGFRCAMDQMGSQSGNEFKESKRAAKDNARSRGKF